MSSVHRGSSRLSAARLVRRHRRPLAGVAAAASMAALGMALLPSAPATRAVIVAAADLPAGRSLAPDDLVIAHVPAGVLPTGVSSRTEAFAGRVLAAPMARGEAVAGHRLTEPPTWAVPPGTMPTPVRFADAGAAGLLGAGQRVDVVAASGPGLDGAAPYASAELVAQDVLVLAVITAAVDAEGILGGPNAAGEQTPLVMLAADRRAALAIAGAQARARLSYLLHPGPG